MCVIAALVCSKEEFERGNFFCGPLCDRPLYKIVGYLFATLEPETLKLLFHIFS